MSTTVDVKPSLGENGYTLNTLELSVGFHGALYFKDAPEHVVSFLLEVLRNHLINHSTLLLSLCKSPFASLMNGPHYFLLSVMCPRKSSPRRNH